jgi:hypothetical protein
MAITATNSGSHKDFEPIEAGTYAARCISMIEIGTISENFQGEEKQMRKVRITWELPTETKVFKEENGEQPYVLSKEFTLSMHEKATLRKYLQDWRGQVFTEAEARAFDILVLLGKPCMLSVTHKTSEKNGKTYAEIAGVSKLMKGLECPPQINPTTVLSYDNFDWKVYDALPTFMKEKISGAEEFKRMMANRDTTGGTGTVYTATTQTPDDYPEAADDFSFTEDVEPAYESGNLNEPPF